MIWYLISRTESEASNVREVRNTQVSLVIAAVFLVSHSVRWLPNIWELQQAGNGVVSWGGEKWSDVATPALFNRKDKA